MERRTLRGEQSSIVIHHDVGTRDEYAKWMCITIWRQNLGKEVMSTATQSCQAIFGVGVYGVSPSLLRWHVTFPRSLMRRSRSFKVGPSSPRPR